MFTHRRNSEKRRSQIAECSGKENEEKIKTAGGGESEKMDKEREGKRASGGDERVKERDDIQNIQSTGRSRRLCNETRSERQRKRRRNI